VPRTHDLEDLLDVLLPHDPALNRVSRFVEKGVTRDPPWPPLETAEKVRTGGRKPLIAVLMANQN
jgi:hypothetical protein